MPTIKEFLPLFDALEAVQYVTLRFTLRTPHGLNIPAALNRVKRAQGELDKLKAALESELHQ